MAVYKEEILITSTAEQPTRLFTLPLEVRQILYDHIFIGTLRDWQYNNQHAYKCHGLLCIFRDRSIPKALLLTDKRIKDEAIHHYYNTAIFRLRT
ncbi:MAG: hypothetical protein Q9188_006962, partial [Gyalolechia gomerana]